MFSVKQNERVYEVIADVWGRERRRDEKIKAVVNIIKKGRAYKECMTGGMPDEAITVMAEDIVDSLWTI